MTLAAIKREYRELPLDVILEPELPARTSMDDEKLDELARSIRDVGLLQPLVVARDGERYEIVAGHRRYLACRRIGLVAVPCVVFPDRSVALERAKLDENRKREDLNPADEALYFAELLELHCGGDCDRLAELVGEKRAYVEGRLVLISGDDQVFAALQTGKIGVGVARQLNRCGEELHRRYLLHQAIVGGATEAVVTGWITEWQSWQRGRDGSPAPAPAAPAPGAMLPAYVFRCYVCGGTEHVHLMTPIQVHQYCQLAVLDKLLAAYRGDAAVDTATVDPRRA